VADRVGINTYGDLRGRKTGTDSSRQRDAFFGSGEEEETGEKRAAGQGRWVGGGLTIDGWMVGEDPKYNWPPTRTERGRSKGRVFGQICSRCSSSNMRAEWPGVDAGLCRMKLWAGCIWLTGCREPARSHEGRLPSSARRLIQMKDSLSNQ
jgi:hypothetical protein